MYQQVYSEKKSLKAQLEASEKKNQRLEKTLGSRDKQLVLNKERT